MKYASLATAASIYTLIALPSQAIPLLKIVEHDRTTLTATLDGVPWSNYGTGPNNVSADEWVATMTSGQSGGSARALWKEPGNPDVVNLLLFGYNNSLFWLFSDVPLSDLPKLSEKLGTPLDGMTPLENGATLTIGLGSFASAPFRPGLLHISFTDVEPVPESGSTFSFLVISGVVLMGANRFRSLHRA